MISSKVRLADIFVLVQSAILGLLFGEIWYLSQAIASALNAYINLLDKQGFAITICAIAFVIICAYFLLRNGYSTFQKLIRSKRFDILVVGAFGLSTSIAVDGLGTSKYQEYISKIDLFQLVLLISIPMVIAFMLLLRAIMVKAEKATPPSFFINDRAIEIKEDDSLGISEKASNFAVRVLNGGSFDSLVFGIDAPWGVGKSSFLNLCRSYWENKTDPKPIVIGFEPLRYKDDADLVEKLVIELVDAIQKNAFIPSIHSLFSKYLRQIKGKRELSFFGAKFELESNAGLAEDTLRNLEVSILDLNRKIIIVVDDLDRLSWQEVKNVLFAIKRSFMLPNVSYVLCYDTENLISMKGAMQDAEKVHEFLEKFVNIKISLFIDADDLAKLVSSDIDKAINNNLFLTPHLLDQIKPALEALVKIYKSKDYVYYQNIVGDIRKIKRLINTMMLLDFQEVDTFNSDLNKQDLIHLLLIYINYPNIFRTIYNAETSGKGEFFSLTREYSNGKSIAKNSKDFVEYLKNLDSKQQQFLLKKVFDYDTLIADSEPYENLDYTSRACFNSGEYGHRNLERYLNLIVKLAKQDKLDSYQFYKNEKDKLISGVPIGEILKSEDFSFLKGDFSRDQLWNIIANSANDIPPSIGADLVTYLIENLPEYSALSGKSIGKNSRQNLIYSLLKLLDQAAWGETLAGRRNNNDESIAEIAEWVFGEGRHAGFGILESLFTSERGSLGLYDLLLFRLYCSADRGGSFFNLTKAISLHEDLNNPTSGLTTEIAKQGMREISQLVFQVFSKQFVKQKINLFEEIDNLSFDILAGKTKEFIEGQINEGKVSQEQVDIEIITTKSRLKGFIVYQLGNSKISSGVGCGYYDVKGKSDNKGIAKEINKYLFNLCFNPNKSLKNYECFLDYCLINFRSNFFSDYGDSDAYVPNIIEMTEVLEANKLKKYWLKNRGKIKALKFDDMSKMVATGNYHAIYKEDLQPLYKALDDFVKLEI